MGSVVQLKNQINNSYFQLKNSVEDKLMLVEEKIKFKLASKVDLVQEMLKSFERNLKYKVEKIYSKVISIQYLEHLQIIIYMPNLQNYKLPFLISK